jgi:hypothetical protein
MSTIAVTEQTRIRRRPERGAYDRSVINGIIDEALVCHIGVAVDGQPRVIPTAIIRIDDHIYIHGSPNNQLLTTLESGVHYCNTRGLDCCWPIRFWHEHGLPLSGYLCAG